MARDGAAGFEPPSFSPPIIQPSVGQAKHIQEVSDFEEEKQQITTEEKEKANKKDKENKKDEIDEALGKIPGVKDAIGYTSAIRDQARENMMHGLDRLKYMFGENLGQDHIERKSTTTARFSEKELDKVMGRPYQFMDIADPRPGIVDKGGNGSTIYGRKYDEKILSKMPLLVITPGLPEFLSSYSDDDRKNIINSFVGVGDTGFVNDLINNTPKETRYYTLKFASASYFKYVETLTTMLATLLSIEDIEFRGRTLGTYSWSTDYTNSDNGYGGGASFYNQMSFGGGGIGFYINSDTQISETFSNDTRESILASQVNSMSDMALELQYLTGINGFAVDIYKDTDKGAAGDQNTFTDSLGGGIGKALDNLINGTKTIFQGGKLIFPELWQDSNYSTSYSVNLKFISPDYDKVSWFLNIGVPLMHLIALTAPRQSGVNGYVSPFLVRAFYRSFFNIDMGIITSLAINKGTEGGWTVDGLPTVVDVNIDFKDLYNKFAISSAMGFFEESGGRSISKAIKNIGLLSYMANMTGVNLIAPDYARSVALYNALFKKKVYNIGPSVNAEFTQGLGQILVNLQKRMGLV